MLLKNATRNTLTAVALAGLLGLTACGSGDQPAEQNTPVGEATASGQASPSQDTTQGADASSKPEGWSDNLETTITVPAEWDGSAGWKIAPVEKSVLSIGDYLVYQLETQGSRPIVAVDGKGDKKTTFEVSSTGFKEGDYSYLSAATAFKDGKKYLVVIENGKSEADPTSVAAVEPRKSIVKVYDEKLDEVWSKTVQHDVNVVHDAVVILDGKDNTDIKNTLDLATGADAALKIPAEHAWAGRYDGVDIYTKEAEDFMGPGSVTNGKWTLPFHEESGVEAFGDRIAIARHEEMGHQKGCDLIDPHTGKALDISGPTGSCPTAKVTSPNGDFVYYTPEYSTSTGLPGIINVTTGKKFTISKEISFSPSAITDTGITYGVSNNEAAVFDLNADTSPKKLPDVANAPSFIASNGIATFADGYFITKK
jgi:hypothetical protein